MPHYMKMGQVPHKRHTQFRKPDGTLFAEELVSTEGFSDIYSLIYHHHPPTVVRSIGKPVSAAPEIAVDRNMQHRSFLGFRVKPVADYLDSRVPVLVNNDLCIHLAAPQQAMTDYFYKNSGADEMVFVHQGEGVLKTIYGNIPFRKGDHLLIPRGTIHQLHFAGKENRLFIVESFSPIRYPKRYINKMGQLLENSPYCERDIRGPETLETVDLQGDFLVKIRRDNLIFPYHYANHPFDAEGWDGNHYPFAFSIYDFEPITGRVHQPPPVHQTFEGNNFVTCAFVPRKYDYHPLSIPAPYFHSNVDSDEVLYYVDGDFMSRKSVEMGQITLHPIGIPHGPHPGTVERSIGKEATDELAVMVDTFRPLKITKQALELEDPKYFLSWTEE